MNPLTPEHLSACCHVVRGLTTPPVLSFFFLFFKLLKEEEEEEAEEEEDVDETQVALDLAV